MFFSKWQEDVEVVLGEGQATEVLVVHVQHIAALFKSLQWAYKQNYFPFMQVRDVHAIAILSHLVLPCPI